MYRVITYPEAVEQIAALPTEALEGYAEVLSALERQPWSGRPQHEDNSEGAVRRWVLGPGGAGQVVYLVPEEQHEVHVILVQWWGRPGALR